MPKDVGLDPNSPIIVEYINSSYSKNGWANIDQEIGGFADIIKDETSPIAERIDAEGYYAICKFKIAGHLKDIKRRKTEEDYQQEMAKLSKVLTEHFGLPEDASFSDILQHTENYARNVADKYKANVTIAAEASAVCQASAVIMQMPRIGGRCDDFKKIAVQHFEAANACADMESSRGCTYLSTAYGWLQNPEIPYRRAVEHLIDTQGMDFKEFSQTQELESTRRSAELGSTSSIGSLGKYEYKKGNFATAEPNIKIAADAGFNRYQYLLGELYTHQGRNEEAKQYFDKARENGFDVDGALKQFNQNKAAKSRHGSPNVHNPQKDALMEQIKEASKGLADVSMSSESKQDITKDLIQQLF